MVKIKPIFSGSSYGVFGTPAVIIDGKVKSVGKIPTKENIKSWLSRAYDFPYYERLPGSCGV
ncbi:MAG: hypothetical protein B6I30_02420 [Desulfobacteraceae bacterium 4572_187]|nr:MAG: hypothetical protein B6I30_02420 [Desulfobacteraceae bacterium 4572_187]RLB77343.1 MAG: hypothetical protein DRH24_16370 [Deltaproteobacteria bacterium]